jgi:hypothetical protein
VAYSTSFLTFVGHEKNHLISSTLGPVFWEMKISEDVVLCPSRYPQTLKQTFPTRAAARGAAPQLSEDILKRNMKDWLWEIGALELAGVVGGSFLSRTRVNRVNNRQKLGYIYYIYSPYN